MARRQSIKKNVKRVNKTKRVEKLANDIKELLYLDSCEPTFLPGKSLWLRMRSGNDALDLPVGLQPLFDPKHDNTNSIKQTIVKYWIAHLQREMDKVLHG